MKDKLKRRIRNGVGIVTLVGLVGISGPSILSKVANSWVHFWDTEIRELKCYKYYGIHIHSSDEPRIDFNKLEDILKGDKLKSNDARINARINATAMTMGDRSRVDNTVLNLMVLKYFYPDYYKIAKNIKAIRILDDFKPNHIRYRDLIGNISVEDMNSDRIDLLVHMGQRFELYEAGLKKANLGWLNLPYFLRLYRDKNIERLCNKKQNEYRRLIYKKELDIGAEK